MTNHKNVQSYSHTKVSGNFEVNNIVRATPRNLLRKKPNLKKNCVMHRQEWRNKSRFNKLPYTKIVKTTEKHCEK